MISFQVTMPYQRDLTDNHRHGQGRGGHKFLKQHVRAWQDELCLRARNRVNLDNLTLTPPLTIRIRYDLPLGSTADPSNFHKSICDGLKAGIGIDDRYFLVHDDEVEYVRKVDARIIIRVESGNR